MKVVRRLALVFVSATLALLLAEVGLRWFAPTRITLPGNEVPHWRAGSRVFRKHIRPDPELGFCPILGTEVYDDFGVLRHDYATGKRPGVERLLFIGDSVTARGKVVAALRRRFGESYEYWNAGVGGYNTEQEVAWYLRHNWRAQPDHVLLTLHPNDFAAGLAAVDDEDGNLAMFATGRRLAVMNAWLFRNSEVYRRYFLARANAARPYTYEDGARDVRAALVRLRDHLSATGVRLSVLVLPLMRPEVEWSDADRRVHDGALALVAELGLRAFDLRPSLARAAGLGLPLGEVEGDIWHPSAELAEVFAEDLAAAKLLP